jgi:hypothetical protein
MATSDDISGGLPAECTSQRPNGAHRQRTIVRRTPGVLVLANDNRKRHEQDLATRAKVPAYGQHLGVLGLGLQVLRGVLQIEGVLRHLGSRAGVRLLAALDLDGHTARLDRERGRRTTTRAPESEKVLGVGHDGLQAGDRHRAKALTRVDGGITR